MDAIKTKISNVEGEIPTVPTNVSAFTNDSNYATESFVNSSIENVAAYYITKDAQGNAFQTKAQLDAATTFYSGGAVRTLTRNDYCVVIADETHPDVSGNGSTCRYIWNNSWQFQYIVNNSGLTQAQFNAVNSGITAAKVGTYDAYASGKQDKITSTNKLAYSLISGTPTIPDISGKLTGTKWSSGGETSESNAYIPYVNEENEEPDWIATYYNNSSVFGFCYSGLNRFKLSKFNNDAGFITSASLPTVPTNVSAFTNDAGYITSAAISGKLNTDGSNAMTGQLKTANINSNIGANGLRWDATSLPQSSNPDYLLTIDAFGSGGRQKWARLDAVGLSKFNNDAGFITSSYHDSTKQNAITSTNKLSYNLLKDTPTIPTDTSDLTNGAGFITENDITGKVDKDTTTGVYRVYANKNGVQGTYEVSDNVSGVFNIGTIPLRTSGGGIRVPSPSNNSDAANKSYVDNHHDDSKEDKLPTAISSGLFLQSTGTPGQYRWSTTQGGVVSITESTQDGYINVDGIDVPIHNAVTKNGLAGSELIFSNSKTGTDYKAHLVFTDSLSALEFKTVGNRGGINFYPHTTNNGTVQPGQYAVTVDRFGLRPTYGNGGSYPTVQQLGRADNKWKDLYTIDAHFSNRPTVNGVQVMIAGDVSVPTQVSAFNNDAGFLTQHQDISGKITKSGDSGIGVLTPTGDGTTNLGSASNRFHYGYFRRLLAVESICNSTSYSTNQIMLPSKSGTMAVVEDLNGYLPLSAGSSKSLTGDLYLGSGNIHLHYNSSNKTLEFIF